MRLFIAFFISWALLTGSVMANKQKTIYGYIEKVTLTSQNLTLSAKLDTGAKTASLNAKYIKEKIIDNETYLAFIVPSKEGDISFIAKYVGDVNIKNRAGERFASPLLRKSMRRPVVMMTVQLGDKVVDIRTNLTNRKHFAYPLLLGREAIVALDGIIDPGLKYTIQSKQESTS